MPGVRFFWLPSRSRAWSASTRTATGTRVRESVVERAFCARVAELGLAQRKVAWIARRGAPDRVVLLSEERVQWVELKAPDGRLSSAQVREHARLCAAGQTVIVIRNIEDARTWTPQEKSAASGTVSG